MRRPAYPLEIEPGLDRVPRSTDPKSRPIRCRPTLAALNGRVRRVSPTVKNTSARVAGCSMDSGFARRMSFALKSRISRRAVVGWIESAPIPRRGRLDVVAVVVLARSLPNRRSAAPSCPRAAPAQPRGPRVSPVGIEEKPLGRGCRRKKLAGQTLRSGFAWIDARLIMARLDRVELTPTASCPPRGFDAP